MKIIIAMACHIKILKIEAFERFVDLSNEYLCNENSVHRVENSIPKRNFD